MPKIKPEAQKMLDNVPNEYVFRSCNGQILSNMLEMGVAFGSMSDEILAHNVNQVKNDFNNWMRNEIGDDKVVSDILKTTGRKQAGNKAAERLTTLKKAGQGLFQSEPQSRSGEIFERKKRNE